jgi:hypothetical protein
MWQGVFFVEDYSFDFSLLPQRYQLRITLHDSRLTAFRQLPQQSIDRLFLQTDRFDRAVLFSRLAAAGVVAGFFIDHL